MVKSSSNIKYLVHMLASDFPTDFKHAIPVLPSRDVAASIQFFVDLGADEHFIIDDKTYGGVHFGAVEFHFFHSDDSHLYLWFCCRIQMNSLENIYELCKSRGILHPNGDIADKEYGHREFSILDPYGVLYTFAKLLK